MKAFEYAEPRTEVEAIEFLSDDARQTEVLAGGTDLVGLMKKMVVAPDRVVNIMEVPSLQTIAPQEDGAVMIGAAVTLDEVLAHPYLEDYPAITDAILGINSMQLQSQGTLVGDLCQRPRCWFFRNGQPLLDQQGVVSEGDNRFHAILGNTGRAKFVSSSRIGPALITLNAKLRLIGPLADEEQWVSVADFFVTPRHENQRETIVLPGQLVTHVVLPAVSSRYNATYEVRHGEGPDDPLAAAAVSLTIRAGLVRQAQIVLGHVAPTPWISSAASDVLVGCAVDHETAEAAGEAAVAQATPLSQNGYKVDLAAVAVKRAVLRAAGIETGGF